MLGLPAPAACALLAAVASAAAASPTSSVGTSAKSLTEAELLQILSRAATVSPALLSGAPALNDTIQLMVRTQLRYAGRTTFVWGSEGQLPALLPKVKAGAARVHAALPDVILEGCVFEIVTKPGVESLSVPGYVFEAFGLPVETRKVRFLNV